MGFFARLKNMVNGFLALFIGRIEEQNPAAVYEAAIIERTQKYQKLKKAIAGLVFIRNKNENELASLKQELEKTMLELDGALATNQDELAVMLIEKQEGLQESIAAKEVEVEQSIKQAKDSMEQMQIYEHELKKLKKEKVTMLAKLEAAKTKEEIAGVFDELSTDATNISLQKTREEIERRVIQSEIGTEIADNSLDNKLDKLRKEGANARAHAKLEEMKRARREGSTTEADANKAKLEALKSARANQNSGGDSGTGSAGGDKTI